MSLFPGVQEGNGNRGYGHRLDFLKALFGYTPLSVNNTALIQILAIN